MYEFRAILSIIGFSKELIGFKFLKKVIIAKAYI